MSEEQLIKIVREQFLGGDETYPIQGSTLLIESGICDSLALLQIALEIEKAVPGMRIDDQDITRDNFGSVARIQQYLGQR